MSALSRYQVVAVIEPSFWLGQPRTNVGSFLDYFSTLVGFERFRAGQFGIRHYCTIGLNSKEANNVPLAEQVMEVLPLFLAKEGVVAVVASESVAPRPAAESGRSRVHPLPRCERSTTRGRRDLARSAWALHVAGATA